jgi:hypothetical protein
MATSLLPFVVLHSDTIFHGSGLFTIFGVMLSVAGTWSCGNGGRLREKESRREKSRERPGRTNRTFFKCVVLTLVSGVIGSGMNIALAFPNPIFDVAHKHGISNFGAANAFLAPYLIGSCLSNLLYACLLLRRNHTFSRFFVTGWPRCLMWAVLMALVFVTGETSYAGGVALLGSFGAVITWGLASAAMILTSSVWDVCQGEWKGQAARAMALGVAVLMMAIVALGFAQYFHQTNKLG